VVDVVQYITKQVYYPYKAEAVTLTNAVPFDSVLEVRRLGHGVEQLTP
jgi:hypothetical protein